MFFEATSELDHIELQSLAREKDDQKEFLTSATPISDYEMG